MVYATLGSISHGTMCPEDLIPTFIDVLDDIKEELSFDRTNAEGWKDTISRLDSIIGDIERRIVVNKGDDGERESGYWESESCMYDLETLSDLLNEFAPPYSYFGAHEGDGSDYGFWVNFDLIDEDVRNGDLIKLPSGDDWPEDELRERPECMGVLYVTDHGNMSLWAPSPTQPEQPIWDVV